MITWRRSDVNWLRNIGPCLANLTVLTRLIALFQWTWYAFPRCRYCVSEDGGNCAFHELRYPASMHSEAWHHLFNLFSASVNALAIHLHIVIGIWCLHAMVIPGTQAGPRWLLIIEIGCYFNFPPYREAGVIPSKLYTSFNSILLHNSIVLCSVIHHGDCRFII